MRKKLLITTALVALVSASNAWAADEIVINTDKSIVDGSGIDVGDKVIDNSQNTQKLIVTDGARLDIHNLGETKNLFNVNGGEVEITDGEIHSEGIANISGGKITIKGGELTIEDPGAEMNISGGTINLSSHPSRTSGFGVNIADENPTEGLIETALGPVEMTGGTINILSGKALDLYYDEDSTGNLITGTSLNISGGELNINEGAGVSVIKGFKDKNNLEKSIVNVTDKGIVNLSGTLRADVSGNGNLNIKTSSALVDGNVSGSNLTFEADHSLSKLVSGTIGDLASLNINKGTLTYDAPTGKIGNLNVSQDAGLVVSNKVTSMQNHVQADNFTSAGNITLDGYKSDGKEESADITVQNALNITGGSITAQNGDLESFDTINISDGTLNLSDSSDITALKGLNISGGEINISDGEIWSLGDINLKDGTVNLSNFAAITTDFDDLDGIFNGTQKPEIAGNINITGSSVNVEDKALLISEGNINLDGTGVIDVQDGATLFTTTTLPDDVEESDLTSFIKNNKATINLTDTGTANISGTLLANVEGDGNLNVKSSSALVDGNVSGSNLTFEADHSLSKAVSGTIGDLASLNVNKDTLTYDKQTGKIGNLNVAGGLDIGTNTVNATNVDFKDSSNLALRVAATDNYGKINADKIGIGNETTIKITLDNGVVGSEGENFKFLNSGNIDGEFTNKIAENGRYNIVQNTDGSFNIAQKDTTASDVVAEAGGTTSNAATAEAWESISDSSNVSEQAKNVSDILYTLSQETSAAGQKAYVDNRRFNFYRFRGYVFR